MVFHLIPYALTAYILGSVPFGKIIAQRVAGIDITQHGSRNIGATNVARKLDIKWGIITMILDILKGFIPVTIFTFYASKTSSDYQIGIVAVGLSALIGHQFSVFLSFRGGKGVATALGVCLAISLPATLMSLVLFILIVCKWNIISLGSIISASAMPLFMIISRESWPIFAGSLIFALLICFKHRGNIQRIIKGEERTWKQR